MTAKINKLTVSGCSTLPCTLIKGTNVSIDVDFTMNSNASAQTATTVVHGVLHDVEIPYPTDYKDACATTNLKCPLKPSSESVYEAMLSIKEAYPSLELYVKWELQDQGEKDIFCFMIPVIIKS
jgi:hypothetical protein